jgi:hypothetical protein
MSWRSKADRSSHALFLQSELRPPSSVRWGLSGTPVGPQALTTKIGPSTTKVAVVISQRSRKFDCRNIALSTPARFRC